MNEINYNLQYSQYHNMSPENIYQMSSYFWRSIKDIIPADRNAQILEIGCGTGFCLLALRDNGYINCVGIDIDKVQVDVAKRLGAPAQWVPVSDQSNFFANRNNDYDCIIAFDVLEHIPVSEQLVLLKALQKVLKPGGIFICQVPNAFSPIASVQRYDDYTHTSSFTPYTLNFLFRSAGLVPEAIGPSIDPDPKRLKLLYIIIYIIKSLLRIFVRGWWRVVLISELGYRRGVTTPVTPNIICVAKK
jgi:2-polyprenyl-3-methyl-5-hydroxy-6-metoxy-1,4-benzoquinol methylase